MRGVESAGPQGRPYRLFTEQYGGIRLINNVI